VGVSAEQHRLLRHDRRERVLSELRGEAVDRLPISFWSHHNVAENSANELADEIFRQFDRFD